jgi:serine phosphatase RsbU (regulator of sigma subunit)/anti-sigma regulatory factor (Ser/Thr protein kinase)
VKPRRVVPIRLVVIATTTALITAAVLSAGALSERNARRALSREIETGLVLEARNLALTSADALLSPFPELTLTPLVKKMMAERPELAFVVVVNHRGQIQGHPDPRRLGEPIQLPADLAPVASVMRLQPGERLLQNRALLVVEAPVSHPSEPNLGLAVVAVERAYVEAAVAASRRGQLAFLAVLLVLGVVAGFVVLGALLAPVGVLRAGLERIGRGDLDTPLEVHSGTELGLLADTVNEMAEGLKRARAETVERERLAHELELARDIQRRLLPQGRREVAGHALVGAHRAAAEVGGDYFDFFALPDGRVAVVIADVSGKGLAGCLVTSMLAALLRALHAAHPSPAALLVALERHLTPTLEPGEFVTMFYGVLDPVQGRLTYASAGHTPALLWRADGARVEWCPTRGIPLGAVRGGALAATLEDRTVPLAVGDLVLLFTDGLSEAFDRAGREMFGFDRIEHVVRERAGAGPDAVIEAVNAAVGEWSGANLQDDQTLLVIARVSTAGARAPELRALLQADPLERLAEAEGGGVHLELPASLDALAALVPWLERLPDLGELDPAERRQLEIALYEACANVAEHGLQLDPALHFELWWVPASARGFAQGADLDTRIKAGYFVLRDRGFPFSPGRWRPRDLDDPRRRLEGRGFGLDLIHLVMDEVLYRPATAAGNLTLLTFDPARARDTRKEDQNG